VNVFELTVGVLGVVLVAVAGFFLWRQWETLQGLAVETTLSPDQRRFHLKQSQRRLFGSLLLFILAGMVFGCLFLEFEPVQKPLDEMDPAEREAAKQAARLLAIYVMTMLLMVMVMLALAVIDFWATARYGMQQQKRLLQEHQEMLAAELEEHRHRQAGMN